MTDYKEILHHNDKNVVHYTLSGHLCYIGPVLSFSNLELLKRNVVAILSVLALKLNSRQQNTAWGVAVHRKKSKIEESR